MAMLLIAWHPLQLNAESKKHLSSNELSLTELEMISSVETSKALLVLADAEIATASSAAAAETAYALALEERLSQIKEMDLSAMNSSEKNELRKEVRAIEKQQKGGGIYISVGAAILIVLLLILLL